MVGVHITIIIIVTCHVTKIVPEIDIHISWQRPGSHFTRFNDFSIIIKIRWQFEEIATKFCWWHDSFVVVTHAKFCSDVVTNNAVWLKWNVRRTWIAMEKSFVKSVPEQIAAILQTTFSTVYCKTPFCILIQWSLKFVPRSPIVISEPSWVRALGCRKSDKPLTEPKMRQFLLARI